VAVALPNCEKKYLKWKLTSSIDLKSRLTSFWLPGSRPAITVHYRIDPQPAARLPLSDSTLVKLAWDALLAKYLPLKQEIFSIFGAIIFLKIPITIQNLL